MNIRFFTLLYISSTTEKQKLRGKEIDGEERILIYEVI